MNHTVESIEHIALIHGIWYRFLDDLKDATKVISLSSFGSLTMAVRIVKMLLALFAVIIISINLINYVDGAPTDTSVGRYYYDSDIPDNGVQGEPSHRYLFRPNYNCPPGSRRDFKGRCKVVYQRGT